MVNSPASHVWLPEGNIGGWKITASDYFPQKCAYFRGLCGVFWSLEWDEFSTLTNRLPENKHPVVDLSAGRLVVLSHNEAQRKTHAEIKELAVATSATPGNNGWAWIWGTSCTMKSWFSYVLMVRIGKKNASITLGGFCQFSQQTDRQTDRQTETDRQIDR